MKAKTLQRLINWYPPYLGAGIRAQYIAPDFLEVRVSMKLRFYNRNFVGTHFGGSLYAMVDPFFMLMLLQHIGTTHRVWDQAATIDFIKPGTGRVTATFTLDLEEIERLRHISQDGKAHRPIYTVDIIDETGALVARAHKTLYIRQKSLSE